MSESVGVCLEECCRGRRAGWDRAVNRCMMGWESREEPLRFRMRLPVGAIVAGFYGGGRRSALAQLGKRHSSTFCQLSSCL